MGNRLKGKVAVVTGSGRGIGRAIILALAEEGASVVINDIGSSLDGSGTSSDPAAQVAREVQAKGGKAVASFDSVTSVAGGEKIIKTALDSFGRLDILIHCAGILRDRMVFNMTEEEFDSVYQVHLKGLFDVARPASAIFRQQRGGRLICFTSPSGLYGNSGQANYGAAKDGVAAFVRVVSRDLGKYGVTVNGIAPEAATRMTQSIPDAGRQARAKAGISAVETGIAAEGSIGLPEDVAPMVAYLCTDHASNINGQIFYVNGGMVSLVNHPMPVRTIEKSSRWTYEELVKVFPVTLGKDLVNPAQAPPPAAK